MTNQVNLTDYKAREIKDKIKKMHFEDNSCLRVIAEKIVNWRYMEISDEFTALKFVIGTLRAEGVVWSESQIRRAIKHCYDPRYYYREEIKEIYVLAGFEIDYIPQVPKSWKGITEWCYPQDDEDESSENWHARRERISSDDMSEKEYRYMRVRDY